MAKGLKTACEGPEKTQADTVITFESCKMVCHEDKGVHFSLWPEETEL